MISSRGVPSKKDSNPSLEQSIEVEVFALHSSGSPTVPPSKTTDVFVKSFRAGDHNVAPTTEGPADEREKTTAEDSSQPKTRDSASPFDWPQSLSVPVRGMASNVMAPPLLANDKPRQSVGELLCRPGD